MPLLINPLKIRIMLLNYLARPPQFGLEMHNLPLELLVEEAGVDQDAEEDDADGRDGEEEGLTLIKCLALGLVCIILTNMNRPCLARKRRGLIRGIDPGGAASTHTLVGVQAALVINNVLIIDTRLTRQAVVCVQREEFTALPAA